MPFHEFVYTRTPKQCKSQPHRPLERLLVRVDAVLVPLGLRCALRTVTSSSPTYAFTV
jgi:hypothetical protein